MKPFDYNKYLKNNPLLREMDEAKNNEDETWFSNADYFRDEHKGYKLKPTDKVSIGDGPIMSYADAVKKYASGKIKEGDMEESFTDRINSRASKSNQLAEPELIKLFPIIKNEVGNEYEAVTQKSSKGEGRIFVIPNSTPGGFRGPIGAVIVARPNGTVIVGSAKRSDNDDVFFSNSDKKIFNSLDVDSILDYISMILSKLFTDNEEIN